MVNRHRSCHSWLARASWFRLFNRSMKIRQLKCCYHRSRYHRRTISHPFRFPQCHLPLIRRQIYWQGHRLCRRWRSWLWPLRSVFGIVFTWCSCFLRWRWRWWWLRGGLRRLKASLRPGLRWGYLKPMIRLLMRIRFVTCRLRSSPKPAPWWSWGAWWLAHCRHIFILSGRGPFGPWQYLSEITHKVTL